MVEPYERWAATMMGQAGRDPIFYATLAIANLDVNLGGEACPLGHFVRLSEELPDKSDRRVDPD